MALPTKETRLIRIGARKSPLARAQADSVAALLSAFGVRTEFVGITTHGDLDPRLLTEIGGTGVFVGAVRQALSKGLIDVAVHSFKDLPTAPADDLVLAAVPAREDARDVLVGCRLADLAPGMRIGTGAPRRAVQLLDYAVRNRLSVQVVPVRGNVDTRLELVRRGECDAVVLAAAGLRRLGHLQGALAESSSQDTVVKGLQGTVLGNAIMLPAPAQGALALEIHTALGERFAGLIFALDDQVARAESLAERGFLARLEAGCTAPVGARAVVKSVRGKSVDLTLAAVIGRTLLSNLSEPTKSGLHTLRIERHGSTNDCRQFGAVAADDVLAQLHDQQMHDQQRTRQDQ